jgi:hypothetical protein
LGDEDLDLGDLLGDSSGSGGGLASDLLLLLLESDDGLLGNLDSSLDLLDQSRDS